MLGIKQITTALNAIAKDKITEVPKPKVYERTGLHLRSKKLIAPKHCI